MQSCARRLYDIISVCGRVIHRAETTNLIHISYSNESLGWLQKGESEEFVSRAQVERPLPEAASRKDLI